MYRSLWQALGTPGWTALNIIDNETKLWDIEHQLELEQSRLIVIPIGTADTYLVYLL